MQPDQRVGVAAHAGDGYVEGGVALHVGADLHVLYVHAGLGKQRHGAENAGQVPVILILQPGGVGKAHHLHGYLVGTQVGHAGYIKLRHELAVLAVAHGIAVHPHIEAAFHAAQVQYQLFAHEMLGQVEPAPVQPRGDLVGQSGRVAARAVIAFGNKTGRDAVRAGLVGKGIGVIGVYGLAFALQFPVAGHVYLPPGVIVEVGQVKARGQQAWVFAQLEPPRAVQGQGIGISIWRMRRQTVYGLHFYVLPFRPCMEIHALPPVLQPEDL